MNQHDFDILLAKYLAGKCNAEEENLVHNWYEKQSENNLILDDQEKNNTEKRIWSSIIRLINPPKKIFQLLLWHKFSIAASVLLLIGFLSILIKENTVTITSTPQKSILNEGIIVQNTTPNTREIKLEDGSLVKLASNSSISYPEHFGNKNRNVYLKGEAFFDIKKDPNKPFIVHAGNITTQVLGTSFSIKSYEEGKTIEVAVKTGRVSVFENDEINTKNRKGIILTPNQKIIFNKQTKEIIPTIVAAPIPLIPLEKSETFVFDEMPIEEVFAKFRKIYGLEIIIGNQALNRCIFTGDLNDLPLSTQLDLICKSINSTHEQRGTSIFINGDGCR